MPTYSHSKIGTYLQCKQKYKFQYIDKIRVDTESIELFLGKRVHEALEKLYTDLQFQKLNSKGEILESFNKQWSENWHDNITIVKKEYTKENYKKMGGKFISDYYEHYKPFNQLKTIGIETKDLIDLDEKNQYHIRIDRLAKDDAGNYYIYDYKTNNSLKAQEDLDEDNQLAMYSIWVKKNYPDAKSVKLVWHFLAFDKEMTSERRDEQIEQLKKDTQNLIKEIEKCDEFPTNVTALCHYCQYKNICPAWKHEAELEKKSYSNDEGKILVDEFAKQEKIKKDAERKIDEIKKSLIDFSKQQRIEVVFGTDKRCSVKEYDKVIYPKDKTELINLIKEKGLYGELSHINYSRLRSKIAKRQIDEEIIKKVRLETAYRVILRKRF